ncbi:MAG TPA: serine hydrolase domain-containing protein [Pedobacter sp.]
MTAIFMATGMLLSVFRVSAQGKNKQIDSLMNVFHAAGKFHGSILVAREGNLIYRKGLGNADIEKSIANTAETRFYIASVSKSFTALLTMQLVEKGKIKTTSALEEFLPGLKDGTVGKVTVHQLLSHTSGIPDFVDPSTVSEKEMTGAWFVDQLNKIKTDFAPGTGFKYANSTYVLLAHIIEKVTGRSYEKNLKSNILNKCGMSQSGSVADGKQLRGIAKGYVKNGNVLVEAFSKPGVFKGAGSIYSTVEDLFKFDQALYTEQLISSKYKEMIFSSQGAYGYGWFIRSIPGVGKVVYHEGGIPGYASIFFRAVDKKYTIVMLSNNQSSGSYKQEIVRSLLGVLNGQ